MRYIVIEMCSNEFSKSGTSQKDFSAKRRQKRFHLPIWLNWFRLKTKECHDDCWPAAFDQTMRRNYCSRDARRRTEKGWSRRRGEILLICQHFRRTSVVHGVSSCWTNVTDFHYERRVGTTSVVVREVVRGRDPVPHVSILLICFSTDRVLYSTWFPSSKSAKQRRTSRLDWTRLDWPSSSNYRVKVIFLRQYFDWERSEWTRSFLVLWAIGYIDPTYNLSLRWTKNRVERLIWSIRTVEKCVTSSFVALSEEISRRKSKRSTRSAH